MAARSFASGGRERIAPGRYAGQQTSESHLKAVADIVASVSDDEELIAAAWLHDIVEDTSVTIGQVERRFGRTIAGLVAEVTPAARSRRAGAGPFALDERLADMTAGAKTLKLADLIDTLRDLRKRAPSAACAVTAEIRRLARALEGGDARLLQRLLREVERSGEPPMAAAPLPPAAPRPGLVLPARALKAFERAFTADDIAEPLYSFDEERDGGEVCAAMRQAAVEVAGIRHGGTIAGYVEGPDLGNGPCGQAMRPIVAEQVVAADASLADVIDVLTVQDWCFVATFGAVCGVVSRRDVQKPAVRMWLFGIITVAEMEVTERVRGKWPDDGWTAAVSPARLAKARELFEERRRRKEDCGLLDCLQLGDKLDILMSDPSQLAAFGLPTPSAARRVSQQVEKLRNSLAHSQPFGEQDWPQIVRLARRVGSFSSKSE